MGLDGGSFPLRIELVKTKQKEEVTDKARKREDTFFTCSLSGLPLVAPLVACEAGRLYTKESVLTALLSKRQLPAELGHLRALSDVFAVRPHRNPLYGLGPTEPINPDPVSPWTCPVTGAEVGKSHERFVAARKCGCVVSRTVWELQPDSVACFSCGAESGGFVELCPPEEAAAEMAARLLEVRGRDKKKKKKKSKKAREGEAAAVGAEEPTKRKKVEASEASLVSKAAQAATDKTARVSSLFSTDKKSTSNSKMFMGITK
jgi:hypothetical protein